ncbi:MAG: helix-turn-helix transcriptional regulator [Bacteroidetes bacterium]|nr:helix-turn-helix transcriptional regulator [Bacteroidota bacterium]
MEKQTQDTLESCTRSLIPIRDTLDILNGKWKLPIMFSLMFENLRFTEMQREIKGITPKMLAKELKDLETNHLIKKTHIGSREDIVQYAITPYGRTLKKIIVEIEMWGIKHRKKIMTKTREKTMAQV